MNISKIKFDDKIKRYLDDRWLFQQFNKAAWFILVGSYSKAKFRRRQPKTSGIYYFRINQQFRALCKVDGGVLKVFKIDNHQ